MAKHVTDRAADPIVASLEFEGKLYEMSRAGVLFVNYQTGNFRTASITHTDSKRVMWRDSPRRRAILAEFAIKRLEEYDSARNKQLLAALG